MLGIELGSFAKAADRLGRSPSAISLQMRKLEGQVGHVLLVRQGRGLSLTETGETMLSYGRRLLDLNDEALMAARSSSLAGWVRLGLPQDLAETWLPELLARFGRLHPNVRVEAQVDRNIVLVDKLANATLDLALVWDDAAPSAPDEHLADCPMAWIGPSTGFDRATSDILPLVMFSPPCIFRQAGLSALDASGIAWRAAFSSPSLSGLWAAVSAGLGVTPRTKLGLPATLAVIDAIAAGLPDLPPVHLSLRTSEAYPAPAVVGLKLALIETLGDFLDAAAPASRPSRQPMRTQ